MVTLGRLISDTIVAYERVDEAERMTLRIDGLTLQKEFVFEPASNRFDSKVSFTYSTIWCRFFDSERRLFSLILLPNTRSPLEFERSIESAKAWDQVQDGEFKFDVRSAICDRDQLILERPRYGRKP
jgi:hypothetical protein